MRPERPPRPGPRPLPGLSSAARRYATLAALAHHVAVEVGQEIDETNIDIVTRKKGRANFATAADHASERKIIARLREHDPQIPVLAEESARRSIRSAERLWVVDPIDGTLNFSRGLPFYCVVIAYVEDGRTRAAAIHAPRTNETFVASEGGGAERNSRAIAIGRVNRLADAFAVASLGFGETKKKDARFVVLNSTCARLRVLGSAALEMAYVAMGRFDLFVHGALSPWDIAAPALIAREAGASVLSLKTGVDAAWDESQVIIANRTLAKAAYELLARK